MRLLGQHRDRPDGALDALLADSWIRAATTELRSLSFSDALIAEKLCVSVGRVVAVESGWPSLEEFGSADEFRDMTTWLLRLVPPQPLRVRERPLTDLDRRVLAALDGHRERRSCEIAHELGLSPCEVGWMLHRLQAEGLVNGRKLCDGFRWSL